MPADLRSIGLPCTPDGFSYWVQEARLVAGQPLDLLLQQHERWARQQGGRAYLERPRYCSKCQVWVAACGTTGFLAAWAPRAGEWE